MSAEKPVPYRWLAEFPTTNGQLVLGMLLAGLLTVVPLVLMAVGLGDRISESVLALLLGGALGLSGVSTYQKVQKWREMPESGAEEPPPGGEGVVVPNALQPVVSTPRPDLGVPDRGVL